MMEYMIILKKKEEYKVYDNTTQIEKANNNEKEKEKTNKNRERMKKYTHTKQKKKKRQKLKGKGIVEQKKEPPLKSKFV